MSDAKKKEKPVVKTRPSGKLPSAFDRPAREPDGTQVAEILGIDTTPPRPSTPSRPSTGSTPEIAPTRDFSKVANSIVREAVFFGAFGGKSKQLYDFLYSQTRAAITPQMSIIITKVKLMAGADIGSEVTLKKNLDRLKACGLIKERVVRGVHGGNEYTVYLPEEVESRGSRGSRPSTGSNTLSFLEGLDPLETTPSSPTLTAGSATTSENPKTYIKTDERNDDDEGFAPLLAAARELTGKDLEARQWRELAELLAVELKIAAGRTTVSNPAAFLTEHLRRRLWKKEKRQLDAEAAEPAGATPAPKVDASQCPDCRGAGMWYPEGFEKGVAKCRHEKIVNVPSAK